MYEMYPDRWSEQHSENGNRAIENLEQSASAADRPRRRARKSHRVAPQIMINLEQVRGRAS